MANPHSAQVNVVAGLQRFGLIDESGALTKRGNLWRIDASYGKACQEILDEVYPSELASLRGDDGLPDPVSVRTWFDHQGFGESNAQQMSATFIMIATKAIPDTQKDAKAARVAKKTAARTSTQVRKETAKPKSHEDGNERARMNFENEAPTVHIDVQIHLPAAATAEQIDQIFASMAKHLYSR